MSLIITRVFTLISAAMLAVLVPVALAGADRETLPNTSADPQISIVRTRPAYSAFSVAANPSVNDGSTIEPQIIDALVIERGVLPTDVVPNLPEVTLGGNTSR